GGHARDGDHVGVLGHEEHCELHRGVFGVVTGDELGFGLGKVEGSAVGLGISGHEVDEEGYKLTAHDDVPGEDTVACLAVYDVPEAEGASAENDANEGEAEG